MAFEKYEPKVIEADVLQFWKKHKIYEKSVELNKDGEKFYFCQGPPYTSGRLHMGHAWNNSLKDLALRYRRMKGNAVWDRAGYDMHGLPTAQKVMEQLGLKNKEEISTFGLDKFIKECKKFSVEKAEVMNEDLKGMGIWMDFADPYMPIQNTFIENVWWLVKKAWENDRLYLGKRTLSWCAEHETALAKHEQEYKNIKDKSIFVKFKIQGADEHLIIWTTTPWTMSLNLAIMANPELDYCKVKVGNETWIIAKELVDSVLEAAKTEGEIIETFKGSELAGIKYEHPWRSSMTAMKELADDNDSVHTVLMSEAYVDTSAGSGLVHCAPGCGPEDYEVGHREGLPPFNTVKEDGAFDVTSGEFAGLKAKIDDQAFIDKLDEAGALIDVQNYSHDYAHCERCHNPVIYRATSQWFFKVEDLKEQMVKDNETIHWVPEAGKNSFRGWLENLRDNSITKQRYWGTPFPLWQCEACEAIKVMGDAKELAEHAIGDIPEDLHKPWIDAVKLTCECGKEMQRHPDVMDVWIDAGTASWNCLNYPKEQEHFEKQFPIDFILEAKEQVRGWFNVLQVCSYITMGKSSFKNVYMHGMLTDVKGVKMSKSLGNVISPYDIIDQYGVDTMRYYLIGAPNAGVDINYDEKEILTRQRHLGVLWNLHNYLVDLCNANEFTVASLTEGAPSEHYAHEERYMLSRLHSTLQTVTQLHEQYRLDEVPDHVMALIMDLSRTYIQFVRDKSVTGSDEERLAVVATIYQTYMGALKMFAGVCPFICEQIYQNLKEHFGLTEESVHHLRWDGVNADLIDESLEGYMDVARKVIEGILAAREKAKLSVRWPVLKVHVASTSEKVQDAIDLLGDIVKTQTNVKELDVTHSVEGVTVTMKADAGKIGSTFGPKTPKIIAKLTSESESRCIEELEKEGKVTLTVGGDVIELKEEHLKLSRNVPSKFKDVDFKMGAIYLDITRTDELEAEGFSREVTRRIQAFRKEMGLEKTDTVRLFIQAEDDLVQWLNMFKDQIADKVGAAQLMISSHDPSKDHDWESEENVKGHAFTLFMHKE